LLSSWVYDNVDELMTDGLVILRGQTLLHLAAFHQYFPPNLIIYCAQSPGLAPSPKYA